MYGCRFLCIQGDLMFDKAVNRVGTKSTKWDKMEMLFGVNPDNGLYFEAIFKRKTYRFGA